MHANEALKLYQQRLTDKEKKQRKIISERAEDFLSQIYDILKERAESGYSQTVVKLPNVSSQDKEIITEIEQELTKQGYVLYMEDKSFIKKEIDGLHRLIINLF